MSKSQVRILAAAAALVTLSLAGPSPVRADEHDEDQIKVSAADQYPDGKQELGGQIGLATGGRVTPGGFYVAGRYLYRLSVRDWFELGVGFTFGDHGRVCGVDGQDNMSCDSGSIGGFAGELGAGLRRYFLGHQSFTPYMRAGVNARVVAYREDKVHGIALPLWAGAGVRAPVSPGVFVGGDALLHLGAGVFNRGLGTEPQAALTVMGTVEFSIGR
jgi:hypothetical protein